MVLLIESLILCALFTIPVFIGNRNPMTMIHNYPPEIIKKACELKLIDSPQAHRSKKTIIKKLLAAILFTVLLAVTVRFANGAETFREGFGWTYLLWTIVNWYDVIFMDILWFCHDKRYVLPGTEGMPAYRDYWCHIKAGLRGMLHGLPAALLAGCIVAIIA